MRRCRIYVHLEMRIWPTVASRSTARYSEEEDEETGAEYITLYGNESNNFVGEYISVTLFADYAESSHAFLRQSAAKQILEVLQQAVASVEAFSEQDEVKKVFACITKLAQDEESMVKCTLLESLQKVASFCAEYDSPLVSLKPLIVSDILVIILKDIADECKTRNTRVRREAFNTLRYLLEENLVTQLNVEDTVSTIYSALVSDQRNVRNLIAAGNFISRMPPVVGEEATEKLLLPKISELCSHPHMRVREACVHFLIDLACFVNSMITENIIVPLFVKLSQDDELHVMKACAETTVMLSCLCLMESRKTVLCLSFIDLLQYGYNVTTSAFKHLGPFITTFAQPAITGLACNRNGDYVLVYSEDFEFPLHSRRTLFQCHEQEQNTREFTYVFGTYQSMKRDGSNDEDSYNNNQCDIDDWYMSKVTGREERERSHQVTKDENSNRNLNSIKYDDQPDLVQSCLQKVNADVENKTNDSLDEKQDINTSSPESVVEVDDFNSFQYWRDPIPEFDDTDLPSVNANVTINNMPVVWHRKGQTVHKARDMTMDTLFKTLKESKRFPRDRAMLLDRDRDRWMPVCETDTVEYGTLPSKIQDSSTSQQNIVPQILIDLFIDMPETFSLLAMDCAYTFPAVLVTIGAANWHLLKDLYNKLVIDGNKRVRNMIANNIHEIAAILGPELATQDLIPMYNSLIDDLEDVRITALTHLSSFIKLLKPSGRSIFLPHLMEFMMTDYNWNWRFREQLSEQLMEMMDYISPNDCWKYVSPVALSLLTDRVSAVRLQALNLVTRLIRNLSADITLLRSILAELAEQFAHSTQWSRRQSFAFLCSCLLKEPVLPDDMFARDVLPHLLDLSWDMIPNVRIAVARTLACDVITYPYFSNIFSPHYDVLTQVLKRLCSDKDRDVRYFASLKSQPLPSLPHFEKTRPKSERR